MTTVKLKFVVKDDDRHGNSRYYLRMPGTPKIRLREPVGTDAFLREYETAVVKVSAHHPAADKASVRAICIDYYKSSAFRAELGIETQKVRRRILDALCEKIGAHGIKYIEERHVRSWMDARADRPESANGLLKALRGLFSYAKKMGRLTHDPSTEIRKIRTRSEGFHTWTIAEVRQFEEKHHIGTAARLSLALLLYLGQRRGDTSRMGRQHVHGSSLRMRQAKTGKVLSLHILPELADIIAASPCGDLAFITTKSGQPFRSPASFGQQFRKWCDEAGLPQCSAHGLRKAGAAIAAENGASDRQLMALFGWSKPDQATVYTAAAEQKLLAASAAELIDLGTKTGQEMSHLTVPPKKQLKKSIS